MPRYVNPGRNVTTIDMGSPTRKLIRLTPAGAPGREGDFGAIEMTEIKALPLMQARLVRKLADTDKVHGPIFDHTAAAKVAEDAVNARMARLRRA